MTAARCSRPCAWPYGAWELRRRAQRGADNCVYYHEHLRGRRCARRTARCMVLLLSCPCSAAPSGASALPLWSEAALCMGAAHREESNKYMASCIASGRHMHAHACAPRQHAKQLMMATPNVIFSAVACLPAQTW